MATFSIGFTFSQVLVMLSVAMFIMLAAAEPVSTDHSGCNRTIGQEIYNNVINIVSYTLILAKLCIISAYDALLVHSRNNIRRTFRIIVEITIKKII